MGETRAFLASDQAGLAAAIVLHAALGAVLVWQMREPIASIIEPPQSMVVSLASDVSLESTAPDPVAVARASAAPVLGEPAPEPESAPVREPERNVSEAPTRSSRTERAPSSRPSSRPSPRPSPRPSSRPSSSRERPGSNERSPTQNPGGRDISDDFERNFGDSSTSNNKTPPANQLGPRELASLESAVGRAVRRQWQGRVPQGPDAEKLVTRVRFALNPDGSLKGSPQVLGTTGQTDLNRNQVGRHQEEAVRAIRLVGRFQLPFDVPANHPGFTLRFDR